MARRRRHLRNANRAKLQAAITRMASLFAWELVRAIREAPIEEVRRELRR